MIRTISKKTANEAWITLVDLFKKPRLSKTISGRNGNTKEIQHVGITIKNPLQRWVVSRYPAINPAFALAEVVWIINGYNQAEFLNYWNRQLPKFAGYNDTYYGAYGNRLRSNLGLDQLEQAYLTLRDNPSSRQVVLQIWDPIKDLPHEKGSPNNPDIPCNVLSLLKVRNNKLEWFQVNRSNDLYLGVPHNIVQFTFLQEIIAGWLGVELGSYNFISDSLHIYEDDIKKIFQYKQFDCYENIDSIAINKGDSESLFKELADKINQLISSNLSNKQVIKISNWNHAPQSFKNILYVLIAESARRRKYKETTHQIMLQNTNQVYKQMWNNWYKRYN